MDCSEDSQEESHQRRENGEEAEKTADYFLDAIGSSK